jgi:sulfite exporter TauE/SafE
MIWGGMIAGFTLGAAGSLHCVGMCGPLSLALPVHHLSKASRFFSLLLYQFGRIATYTAIGLILGLAGKRIYIAGYQQAFSIAMGTIVLLLAVLYFINKRSIHLSFFSRFYLGVQRLVSRALRSSKGPLGFFLVGMANGLLPCGMVYVAMAAALSFSTVGESAGFMALFGAGTLPMMMGVVYAGQAIKPQLRFSLQRLVPYAIAVMGIVLILRGLNLGIPFISPVLPQAPGSEISCHL